MWADKFPSIDFTLSQGGNVGNVGTMFWNPPGIAKLLDFSEPKYYIFEFLYFISNLTENHLYW